MSKVGIVANPASGKDIRRLVSYASVMGNTEKTNQIKRLILGIDSTGTEEILIMPEYYGFGLRILADMEVEKIKAKISILEMPVTYTQEDSTLAVKLMEELGVGCIVTLGGDGTNRAVAKGINSTPLVPISTGTNNVFPIMVEATIAGLVAGIVARKIINLEGVLRANKNLVIVKNGVEIDIALVDVVVLNKRFIGSRAIWNLSEVNEIICTRSEPNVIGLSSIAGYLHPNGLDENHGMYIRLGDNNMRVRAPVLPGAVREIGVQEFRIIALGETIEVTTKPCILALDGEREITVLASDEVKIGLKKEGPAVVDINAALREAVKQNFFISKACDKKSD